VMAPAGPFLSRPHMLRSRAALGYPSLARRQRAGLLGELDHRAFNLMEVRDDLFSADNDKCPQAQADAEGDAKSQEAARAVRLRSSRGFNYSTGQPRSRFQPALAKESARESEMTAWARAELRRMLRASLAAEVAAEPLPKSRWSS
jgi:hypothetical protein